MTVPADRRPASTLGELLDGRNELDGLQGLHPADARPPELETIRGILGVPSLRALDATDREDPLVLAFTGCFEPPIGRAFDVLDATASLATRVRAAVLLVLLGDVVDPGDEAVDHLVALARDLAFVDHADLSAWAHLAAARLTVAAAPATTADLLDRSLALASGPLAEAACGLVAGQVALASGDRAAALDHHLAAHRTASGAGAAWLAFLALVGQSEADPETYPMCSRDWDDLLGSAVDEDPVRAVLARRRTVEVVVLGAPLVRVHGSPVTWRTSQACKLLTMLALAGDDGERIDRTIRILWPDKEPGDADGNLATALWECRRHLDIEAWRLSRDEHRLRFDTRGVRVDLLDAIGDLRSGDRDRTADAVERLRAQPVLPEWQHDEWVIDLENRREAVLARRW